MDLPLIIIRALHFAAALSLAGVFGFAALVAGDLAPKERQQLRALAWISAGLTLVTAPLWLVVVAVSMSGDSFGATAASGAAAIVLAHTQFGHALALRIVIALLSLCFVGGLGSDRRQDCLGAALAAMGVAAIAWQGHAGAEL